MKDGTLGIENSIGIASITISVLSARNTQQLPEGQCVRFVSQRHLQEQGRNVLDRKERTSYRKANGLCVTCGKPLDRKGNNCTTCVKKNSDASRRLREWYISHGICPKCKDAPLMGNERLCPECRANESERLSRYNRSKPEYRKRHYEKYKALGLCVKCGRKVLSGYATCPICSNAQRDHNNFSRDNFLVGERTYKALHGICYRCGKNPCVDGKKLCADCYDASLRNLQKARAVQRDVRSHNGTRVLASKSTGR